MSDGQRVCVSFCWIINGWIKESSKLRAEISQGGADDRDKRKFLPLHQRWPPRRRPSPCRFTQKHLRILPVRIKTRIKTRPVLDLTDSLGLGLFLGEHPQDEVGLLGGFEGRRDDQVLARREAEPGAHLSQVDEGLRASAGGVAQEEVLLHVDARTASVLPGRWTPALIQTS